MIEAILEKQADGPITGKRRRSTRVIVPDDTDEDAGSDEGDEGGTDMALDERHSEQSDDGQAARQGDEARPKKKRKVSDSTCIS